MFAVCKDREEAVNIDNAEILCVKYGGDGYCINILSFDGHLKCTLGKYSTEKEAVFALNCLLTAIASGDRIHCMLDENTTHSASLEEEI